jgi:hypothetical protein
MSLISKEEAMLELEPYFLSCVKPFTQRGIHGLLGQWHPECNISVYVLIWFGMITFSK